MITITIQLTEDEAAHAQSAADRCEMNAGEFARWAVVVQSASVLGVSEDKPIENPWGG